LPGDAKEFLRKVGLCSTRQRITAARLPLRTPLGTSLLKSSTKERVKHVAPFPLAPKIYANPELMQGFGLNNTLGVAGFPN
jgi:hypothetical protein